MKPTRIIIASDIHYCEEGWYGMAREEKGDLLAADLAREYQTSPYDALLLLGDYSLDHWVWGTKGTYLTRGLSETGLFARQVLPRLAPEGVDVRMIAGNHEQYGEENWERLTGHHRRDHLLCGGVLFILCDTFGGDLDPTEHSDGTYVGVDVGEIRALMARYPHHKVILCAHWFHIEAESEEFRELLRAEERILCLLCGHAHISRVLSTGEENGNKPILYTGHYSYSGEKSPLRCLNGYRELILEEDRLTSAYIAPAHTYVIDNVTFHTEPARQDELEIRWNGES